MNVKGRQISITTREPEAFNLASVVADPRSLKTLDVESACDNLVIQCTAKNLPRDVTSLVKFIFTGYFPLAHRTGLYNRQRNLWESLSRVASARVEVVRAGILLKVVRLPVYDIHFYSHSGQPLFMARLVKRQNRQDFDRRCSGYLNSFVKKVSKTKASSASLCGAFFCVPDPVDQSVVKKFGSITGANDPASKFDSRLPPPVDIPFNMLAMDYDRSLGDSGIMRVDKGKSDESEPAERGYLALRLVLPELPERKR